jgi:hypothetical protein
VAAERAIPEVARALVERGADDAGDRPLTACAKGLTEVALAMVGAGADVTSKIRMVTASTWGQREGPCWRWRWLWIARGADVDIKGDDGDTACHGPA